MDTLRRGTLLWLPGKQGSYELGEVSQREGSMLGVDVLSTQQSFTLDLESLDVKVFKANKDVVEDMTALRNLHLPGILYNIRERALADEPYTFMGNTVLVAVNPLKHIEAPEGILGTRKALNAPHPYAIAEVAFQQMSFGAGRRQDRRDSPVNQSILVSGESGAGKTESSKMVLEHLVHRCVNDADGDAGAISHLDRRLLDSNPILEAFGNASTKRNHNSSRFGKFLKLHFEKGVGGRRTVNPLQPLHICGASIETYLLERSRVTLHGEGERSYHIFYMLLAGASSEQRLAYDLDHEFVLTRPKKRPADRPLPRKSAHGMRISLERLEARDLEGFTELCESLSTFNIPPSSSDPGAISQERLFGIVAAMLHLGNVSFENDENTSEGYVALVQDEVPLQTASELLGVDSKDLRNSIMVRKVKTVHEQIIVKRDARGAKDAADAMVKSLYVQLFDWLVRHITSSFGSPTDQSALADANSKKEAPESFFIGVLDIFGFEVFSVNDFEQLLINFANEALQSSFKKQVLEAELKLYASEGLQVPDTDFDFTPDDMSCMNLLRGINKRDPGVLGTIDAEGRQPQPLDEKMCAHLHRAFKGHPKFPTPHPRDQRTTFKILHFAGEVKYTVGSFIEKNSDKMPAEVNDLFEQSANVLVKEMFPRIEDDRRRNSTDRAAARAGRAVRNISTTIISGFREQMDELLDTLGGTRCSYIRCIKPNPTMRRRGGDAFEEVLFDQEDDELDGEEDDDDNDDANDDASARAAKAARWFDNPFVSSQLENLGIPQTTKVMQLGFPTRVPFDFLLSSYKSMLPAEVLRVWETIGEGNDRAFIKALFFAFHIEPSTYKLGLTKVFFRSGMLDQLTQVLDAATSKSLDEEVVQRFRGSFARQLWRRTLAKVRAVKEFEDLLAFCQKRNSASTIIQRLARRKVAEMEAKAELARQRELKQKREQEEKKEQARLAAKREAAAQKAAAEAEQQRLREAADLKARAELESEMRRAAEEAARIAAETQAKAKEYRLKAEKEEREARKLEQEETKRTIEELGGEEAYLEQVEHERNVTFSRAVTVREFPKYFSNEHAMAIDLRAARKRGKEKQVVGDDLEAIARTVRVVLDPASEAPLPSVEEELVHRDPKAAAAARKSKRTGKRPSLSATLKRMHSSLKRRSYAPTMAGAKDEDEAARAKFALMRQGIPEAALSATGATLNLGIISCPAVEYCVDTGAGKGDQDEVASAVSVSSSVPQGAKSLMCLFNGGGKSAQQKANKRKSQKSRSSKRQSRKSQRRRSAYYEEDDEDDDEDADSVVRLDVKTDPVSLGDENPDARPGTVIMTRSGPRYNWAPCFCRVEGFELNYFESAEPDGTGEMRGVTKIGTVHIGSVAAIEQFSTDSLDEKLAGTLRTNCVLRLRVRSRVGYHLVLAFPDEDMKDRVADHIERALSMWKAETAALKQMARGEFRDSERVEEAKKMLEDGRMSRKSFKQAMLQQLSSESEYAQLHVAMYGEDDYDKRVKCATCGAINFLVGAPPEPDGYICHTCKEPLELPDEMDDEPIVESGGTLSASSFSGRSSGMLTPRASRINSTVFDELDAEDLESLPPPPSFPITISLKDKSSLTVFEVDLLPHPRKYEPTQSRMYFYTFRCQYVEPVKPSKKRRSKAKPEVHHWIVDQPFEAFHNLHRSLGQFAEEWNKSVDLPEWVDVEPARTERETAELRLNCLNEYMEAFLELAQVDEFIFQAPPVRIFFNLRALKVAPLSPEELEDLRPAFETLETFHKEKKQWSAEIYDLFVQIVEIEPRLDATASADAVFNSIEYAIARLSYQEKSDVFHTGQRYMQTLESVNAYLDELVSALDYK
ncbi:Myosin-6 [Hondaea fermentalgiana]|uniref:Myosin-6 n=1 Tax=Hondaea fermentalgiana TaxID=2315210 RepID=A0A2R5G653_9STRA|nr:Myosin-6 [Hondaea fermentalgiana]|eukprot:GBG26015.1 Myosin-6 [Hondaea fermentalgiana]